MKIRHQLIYIERVQRRVTVEVDMPEGATHKDIYDAARRFVTLEARKRENDPWLQPDLQFISSHILGEVPDGEDAAEEHQPSDQVPKAGEAAAGNVGAVDVTASTGPGAS